jgi:flagellar biosynthetic protein FlhB
MSEDRTQPPTRRRREEARQRGQVPRSAELTAGAGLLAAALLLGAFGPGLARGLIELVQRPLDGASVVRSAAAGDVAGWLRDACWSVLGPLAGIGLGVLATVVLVHQAQVGGLWAPRLLAPDPARLLFAGGGAGARASRGLWSLAKAALLVGAGVIIVRAQLPAIDRLSAQEFPALAGASMAVLIRAARWLALAVLAIGAADFALCWRRVEEALRQTPDEYREELRAADGDPALRARRRKLALSWRRDAAEILPGASLLVLGPNGLAVLLAGSPPPGRVTVRQVARGIQAAILRREACEAGIPVVDAPRLAGHFARGRAAGPSLPPDLATELAAIWPRGREESPRTGLAGQAAGR